LKRETIDPEIFLEAKRCSDCLKQGGVLLYPADSLWGLGCDALNKEAIERISNIKQRPGEKHFITLISDWRMLQNVVSDIPDLAGDLLDIATEPLTIIYPAVTAAFAHLASENGKIAVRLIEAGFAHEVLKQLRRPLISTSANLSGQKSALNFNDIPDEIVTAVDCTANPNLPYELTGKASKLIELEADGRIKVLR
jgi:L-threonylcarbamoyladenylate synthase